MNRRGSGADEAAATERSADAAFYEDDEPETSTGQVQGAPSTLRGPATLPLLEVTTSPGRDAISVSFEEETQARPVDNRLLHELRGDVAPAPAPADLGIDYELLPSLEVRHPFDTYEAAFTERDPATQMHVKYESAQIRRSDRPASREPSYGERAYREEPSYEELASDVHPQPATAHAQNDQGWGRREESGPRERPAPDARSYAAPAPSYDDVGDSSRWARDQGAQPPAGWSSPAPGGEAVDAPMIPQAPRVPDEMQSAFVMGVQPIRHPTPDAWGTPRAHTPAPQPTHRQAVRSSMPPAYAEQVHYTAGGRQQAQSRQYHEQQYALAQQGTSYPVQHYPGQRGPTLAPMHAGASGAMPAVSASGMLRAQPLGEQLVVESAAAAKIGRFAWFVAGAAFGITFAFFATGFFTGKGANERSAAPPLPPAMAATAMTTPAAGPPAGVIAPAAPAVALAVVPAAHGVVGVMPPVAAPALAVAPPVAQTTTQIAPQAAAPAAAPIAAHAAQAAKAAPPRGQRAQAPRRPAAPAAPAAPVSLAPKNLGGGGPGADDEPHIAPPSAPAGDLGDLLGAGLRP